MLAICETLHQAHFEGTYEDDEVVEASHKLNREFFLNFGEKMSSFLIVRLEGKRCILANTCRYDYDAVSSSAIRRLVQKQTYPRKNSREIDDFAGTILERTFIKDSLDVETEIR